MIKSSLEISEDIVSLGIKKSSYNWYTQLLLGVFGGIFIAIAGVSSAIVSATITNPSLAKLISALIFPFGLIMIILTSTELFTSNCLIVVSVADKKSTVKKMARNLSLVYLGNAIGAFFIVLLLYLSNTYKMFDGVLGINAIAVAEAKMALKFWQVFASAIICNVLVSFAVWMSFITKNLATKMFVLFFPTMLFVIGGYEHVVANFYYWGAGMAASKTLALSSDIFSLSFILTNLVPATLGNIVGGMGIVGIGTWYLFLKNKGE